MAIFNRILSFSNVRFAITIKVIEKRQRKTPLCFVRYCILITLFPNNFLCFHLKYSFHSNNYVPRSTFNHVLAFEKINRSYIFFLFKPFCHDNHLKNVNDIFFGPNTILFKGLPLTPDLPDLFSFSLKS